MTTLSALPESEQKKIAAWTACRPIDGFAETEYRIDGHGNLILWSHYGTQSDYGWEIDHVHPSALGGPDDLSNLRGLHWRVNRSLGGHVGNALRKNDAGLMKQLPGLFGLGAQDATAANALSGERPMTQPSGLFGSSFGFSQRR
jgi:hypothetical protein